MANAINDIKKKLIELRFRGLNVQQKKAVLAPHGPLLVIAGAGSGKTTVLINRIVYLMTFGDGYYAKFPLPISREELNVLEFLADDSLHYDRATLNPIMSTFAHEPCPPDRIMAITFTNKAAGEIKERLEKEIGEEAKNIWSGTFHSICVRLLRRFADFTEYGRDFSIYDQDDSKKIISDLIKEMNINDQELTPKYVATVISNAKNDIQSPEKFFEKNQFSEKRRLLAELYKRYQKRLKESSAFDFDDLICETVKMLQNEEEPRNWCQNKFLHVLVDEYQDTNHAQYQLMKLLSGKHRNIMVVGDDDQSIYKFRGAAVENILNFDKEFPDATVITLDQNYRSTGVILEAANGVIANNESRREKKLWSNCPIGDLVWFHQLKDQEEEAQFVADKVSELRNNSVKLRDIAVLYRTRAQGNTLETVFSKAGIPHRLLAGLRFYDHAEVKDVLAYLRFINNSNDIISFQRIINTPRRGIGNTTVDKILAISEAEGTSPYEVLEHWQGYNELRKCGAKLGEFASLIREMQLFAAQNPPSDTLRRVLHRSGYLNTLLGEENDERRDNVNELISSAMKYEQKADDPTLSEFLEEVALVSDVDNYDERTDAVTMMTVHASKGLEFPVVFITGMEENIFPSQRSSATQSDIEEERRLCYVAMTRAKLRLFMTCCQQRLLYGKTNYNQISRFISEIPKKYLRTVLYGGQPEVAKVPVKPRRPIYTIPSFDVTPKTPKIGYRMAKEIAAKYQHGDRVVHGIFGTGTVIEAKPMGGDVLYVIRFDKGGEKKLMGTYAKLKSEE